MTSTTNDDDRDAGSDPGPDVELNPNVRGLAPSATLAINERSAELRRQGRRISRLGFGQSPFPVPEPVVEELKANAFRKDYLPVRGLPALRRAVAEHHRRILGIDCGPEDVLIGPGSKELMFHLQLVCAADLVLPTPSWVSYAPQARILGRWVSTLPTRPEDGWRLQAADLERLCRADPGRPRILILNDPSNPAGSSHGGEEHRQIAAVARRYRILVLSDEIYGQLDHRGEHRSLAPLYPEGTIVSGGLSKWCGAGGWRLGVMVFPRGLRPLLAAMAAVASETYTTTSAPIQYAAVRAYRGGDEIEAFLRQARRILAVLGRRLAEMLRAAGVGVVAPEGGFYLFPDFGRHRERLRARGIATSVELCERLLEETGVALLPGSDFLRPPGELTARLAYVDFDGGRALAAAARIPPDQALGEEFLRACCGDVLEAGERICQWATGAPPITGG